MKQQRPTFCSTMPPHFCESKLFSPVKKLLTKEPMNGSAEATKLKRM